MKKCQQKIIYIFIIFFCELKKISSFLNIRNMHFDRSSPVQPTPEKKIWENFENFQKIIFFPPKKSKIKKKMQKKKVNLLVLPIEEIRGLQSTPFQISGGWSERHKV